MTGCDGRKFKTAAAVETPVGNPKQGENTSAGETSEVAAIENCWRKSVATVALP